MNHLSASNVSILKVWASVDDDSVDDLRVYFDERLHLHKATWTYKVDNDGRRFYWAATPRLDEMKKGGGFISFDVQHPQKGKYKVEIIALSGDIQNHNTRFIIHVD